MWMKCTYHLLCHVKQKCRAKLCSKLICYNVKSAHKLIHGLVNLKNLSNMNKKKKNRKEVDRPHNFTESI